MTLQETINEEKARIQAEMAKLQAQLDELAKHETTFAAWLSFEVSAAKAEIVKFFARFGS